MDEYNSDKSLLRVTTERIPSTYQLAQDCAIPLAILVKPFGELPSGEEIPAAGFNNKPIIRCKDCRAYINPFVRFIEGGKRWVCNFCKDVNGVEEHYFSPLGEDGYRQDLEQRPELVYGTVDFIASMEYMNRPPMPPTYIFLFDVSQPAIESGYLQQATHTIKGIIEEGSLPGAERARVCFLAYDKNLYFFNLRATLKQPQMMIVTETSDVFLPQPDDMLVSLSDSYDLVLTLLDNFPNYFVNSQAPKTIDTCFVASIQAANNIAKHIGGKMFMFQVSGKAVLHPMLQNKAQNANDLIQKFGSSNPFF